MHFVWANSAEGVAVISTLVGLLCNVFVKGVMKSIGFIFKNSLKAWPDMNQTLAVLMPSTMHLLFNTMALLVPVLGRRFGFASTAVLGALIIVTALVSASFIHTATLLFLPLGVVLGLGCALNFHSGVKLVNQLTSKNNGFANGIAQAGSTLGAIAVSFAVAGYFSNLDFKTSLLALGASLTVLVPVSSCFYWPSKYVASEEKTVMKCAETTAPTQSIFKSYKYYCFVLSQTLNALGFLNFTTYLAAHLHQANGWNDMEAASAYAVNQSVDFITRLLVPMLSDRVPRLRPWIYCVGVVGTGATMALLAFAKDTVSVYAVCASSGIFSACFIGIWNSLVKDEVGPDHFFTVYSHSLATCGIVQFGLTVLVVFFVQGTSASGSDYTSLLVIFGSIMATAALPIFAIMIGNAYFSTSQEKDVESPMEEKPKKTEGDAVSQDLGSWSTCTSTLSLDSKP